VFRTDTGDFNVAEKLNQTPIVNSNFYEVRNTTDFSKFRSSEYIVEVILPKPDGRAIISSPCTWTNTRSTLMQIRVNEIVRRETILLSKFIGVDTLIFRRKYFGDRCINCFNTKIEKVVKDNCKECYGTSFLGGYYPGLLTKVHFEISPNITGMSYQGKVETNNTSAWTVAYPNVDPLDLLIRIPDFKVFRIDSINCTEIQTVQVRQIMNITELNKSSIEMKLLEGIVPSEFTSTKLIGTKSKINNGHLY
jgi:hypothetical protein